MVIKIIEESGKRRTIGNLFPKKLLFTKKIKGSKHIFKKLDAIGIDGKYFLDNLLPQNYTIEVKDTETNIVYKVTAEEMKKNGEFLHFNGYNLQIFLPRIYWNTWNQ